MTVLGVACAAIAAGLVASFLWAAMAENLLGELKRVAASRWGVVTLADLGVGLALAAAWIAWLERRWWRIVPWWIALGCFGNFTLIVYVGWRCARQRTIGDVIGARAG